MYIFVTYGEPGWRGVQERGLAIAQYFSKNEVLFFNGYDSQFIKERGFRCKTIDLSLADPEKIKFPQNAKALIFADLPTNELFNLSLFFKAQERSIPIVVLDQIYRRGQLKEGVYKNLTDYTDLFLLNGLKFMKKEETRKVKIIPPLPEYRTQKDIREKISQKYKLDSKKPWIFVSGYFKPAFKMVTQAYPPLYSKTKDFILIICGLPKAKKTRNRLFLPYLVQNEFLEFLDASDVLICKFGYLQILEALALKTPVIVAGEAGYVLKMEILDKRLQEVIGYAKDSRQLISLLYSLIKNKNKREVLQNKIAQLHDQSLNGAKMAAQYIKKIKIKKRKKVKKKILILVNDEIKKGERLIASQNYLYVLGMIVPVSQPGPRLSCVKRPDEIFLSRKIDELILKQREILPHTFKQLYLFSCRKYDGLVNIFPWYHTWIKSFLFFLHEADEIRLSLKAKYLLLNLLLPFKFKIKLIGKI